MTRSGSFPFLAAILAVGAWAAPALAEIARRELAAEIPVSVAVAAGGETRCKARAWSGEVLTTDRGDFRWEELKSGAVLATLKAIVADRDAAAAADGYAIVLSLPEPGTVAKFAQEWARRQGADEALLKAAEAEAAALRAGREERRKKASAAGLATATPEAGSFPSAPWAALSAADADKATAESIEEARALLAKAGASANLHQTAHVALLAESGDAVFAKEAAWLETVVEEWMKAFAAAGAPVVPQGKFVVVMMSDPDRWRVLAASAGAGDPARLGGGVTIYPTGRPLVLLAPSADPATRRLEAARGVARAVLHSSVSPVRPAPWINEGLPMVMADVAVPAARLDATARVAGVRAIRAGVRLSTVLDADYASKAWTDERPLALSLSYVFTRWLYEQVGLRVVAYAKDLKAGESDEQRFERVFGSTRARAVAKAATWFQTND